MIITTRIHRVLTQFSRVQNNLVMKKDGLLMTKHVNNEMFLKASFDAGIDADYGISDLKGFLKLCPVGSVISVDKNRVKINNLEINNQKSENLSHPKQELEIPVDAQKIWTMNVNGALMKMMKGDTVRIQAKKNIVSVINLNEEVIAKVDVERTSPDFHIDIKGEMFRCLGAYDYKLNFYEYKGSLVLEALSPDIYAVVAIGREYDVTNLLN
ncbi:hypothetical protein THF1C08_80242 [Vibrio jasicida]|uniref:Uncharacterized protein n=1 Tax=Vibrio jasicida TaxID=766224 RepID=A0AAU9QX21_9VIBR|nr:hypothetical protein THF1C08_80242 [Vibrio jasicida]CAH1603522.1 hypothetical protein THF1A12_70241 [Vibrio jasicida]